MLEPTRHLRPLDSLFIHNCDKKPIELHACCGREQNLFTLVIGGSASGKSDYAERHVLSLKGDGPRIYIAAMEPFGEEAQVRIARHHAMRRDRGFETIECYRNIGDVCLPEKSKVLLEDLGNLTANELFGADLPQADAYGNLNTEHIAADLSDRIAAGIERLLTKCSHLTIVTNEVFSGGKEYEGETLTYLRVLAALNRKLAARADLVVEVVCGLPEILKSTETGR